jgi:hypothetical protein
MQDWYNNITYGNLSQKQLEVLSKQCIADDVIPILDEKFSETLQFPLNNSQTTIQELNEIVSKVNSISSNENATHFERYKRYDRSLLQSIIAMFQTKGLDVEEVVMSINEDIKPTIIKLKQKYQRPRPNQLAQYYKLKLFPFNTLSGHSPSYPSGHTLQAYCILNIIGNKHPQAYDFCKKFIDDVANSRVYMGIHYPSDNDASYLIGKEILKLKSITQKYQI